MDRRFSGLKRPATELLIIIAGVLIALWVENWRQTANDRVLEREYLNRLVLDLQQDSLALAGLLEHVPRTYQAAALLRSLSDNPTLLPGDPVVFVAALEEARSIQNSPWNDGTYTELLATGNMSVLRNGALKSDLNLYYMGLEGLYTWVERRVARSFRDESAHILPADVREGLRHFWRDPTRAPSDEWLSEAAKRVDVTNALAKLRSIPRVSLMLGRVADVTSGHQEWLERTSEQHQALLNAIRGELER